MTIVATILVVVGHTLCALRSPFGSLPHQCCHRKHRGAGLVLSCGNYGGDERSE